MIRGPPRTGDGRCRTNFPCSPGPEEPNRAFAFGEPEGTLVTQSTHVNTTLQDPREPPMARYEITVETGNVGNAGTDANVHITLYGSLASAGPVNLDDSRDNFEQGAIDHSTLDLTE